MMRPTKRRQRILDALRENGSVTVEAFAESLATSRETVRRDLADLADRGLVRKFHGGATLPVSHEEGTFASRMAEATQEKRIVARAAAALFAPGDSIMIDTGTTTVLFAEELAQRTGFTVITNSLTIAQILGRGAGGRSVFVIGGEYREDAAENVGTLAVEQLARFNAAHAVITVTGIVPGGVFDFQLEEAEVARAMIARANRVTVIADGSKLNRPALFQVCPLADIDRLVVDIPPDSKLAAELRKAGVEIVVADNLRREP